MSSQKIWDNLLEGNKKFIAGECNFINAAGDEVSLRQKLADHGQSPKVAVLTCADSRVSPELIFNKNLGELFVIRVAGNVATSEAIGSIEYAVMALQTEVVVVLGHSKCGAVTGALEYDAGSSKKSALDGLLHDISSCVGSCGNVDEAISKNATLNAEKLTKNSELMRTAVDEGKLKIVSAVYDLNSGEVRSV